MSFPRRRESKFFSVIPRLDRGIQNYIFIWIPRLNRGMTTKVTGFPPLLE
ncbi:MAG: hypothetical protein ACEY3D_02500 [Rickettsia sp.]